MASSPSEHRVVRIHELDIKHRQGLHRSELIHRDEGTRRLKLRLISIRDDNALLEDKLRQTDISKRQLTKQHDKTSEELKDARQAARAQEAKLKKQATELNNLRAEVDGLGSSMQDSGKVLQEKFALTRELDRLRPEIEHLQSQVASNQAAVAEKNRLQRQLDSLEVELENEKRTRQRTQDKESKTATEELKARAEDAEKRLATEKREREKIRKEHEKALAEASTRSERMEERLSTLKDKVKGLQAELKEAKAETERQRSEAESTHQSGARAKKATINGAQPSRKRRVEESSFGDITVETAGNDHQVERRPIKKRGLEHALMGEKSTFSVTPYLNRNKSMTDASQLEPSPAVQPAPEPEPAAEPETEEPAEELQFSDAAEEFEPAPAKSKVSGAPKAQKPRGRPKAKPLDDASPANKKKNTGKRGAAKTAQSTQQEGSDAMDHENVTEAKPSQPAAAKPKPKSLKQDAPSLAPSLATRAPAVDAGAKKKRKLLGANSTLFDDDDGEAPPVSTTINPSQAGKRKRAPLGAFGAGAFGGASFSPLKRDRRGVGASFLG